MMRFFKNPTTIFIFLLFVLSLLSYWRMLSFYFFQDDYQFIWYALFHPLDHFLAFRHPGTPLEAVLLTPLFGLHAFPWQLVGLLIKITVAYLSGVFVYRITYSWLAQFLTSVFFAVSYIGAYAVNAFNYHVPALVVLFLLLSFIYLAKSIQEKTNHIWQFFLFLFIAFSLDPARGIPALLLIPFLFYLFPKSKKRNEIKKLLLKIFSICFIAAIPLLPFWYFTVSRGEGTQLEVFIRGMMSNPSYMITKTKDIGNFFATLANLFIDTIYGLVVQAPKYEVAYYQRFFGVLGMLIFVIGGVCFYLFLKKKSKIFGIVSFFIFWTFLFYIPNFLAEPRAAMSSINHYLFISGVGFICLLGYLCSFIKSKKILLIFVVIFVIFNIYKTNLSLSLQYPYRSTTAITTSWQTILQTVPNEKNDILFFTGDTYWVDYSLVSFGAYNLLLLHKNPDSAYLPLLTTDRMHVLSLLCDKKTPLSHIYTWHVEKPGVLVNTTQKERNLLSSEAWCGKSN